MSEQGIVNLIRSLKARGLDVKVREVGDDVYLNGLQYSRAWIETQLDEDPQCLAILLARQLRQAGREF